MDKPNKFAYGKIYRIDVPGKDGGTYIGSTCEKILEHRIRGHMYFSRYQKYVNVRLYKAINSLEHKWDQVESSLVANFPCSSLEELREEEAKYIRQLGTLNTKLPGRTSNMYYHENRDKCNERGKEYRKRNEEVLKKRSKVYRETHREELAVRNKHYRECNKEKLSKQHSDYYEKNKETIIERVHEYARSNKEQIAERSKAYRAKNFDSIAEKKKAYGTARVECEHCGGSFSRANLKKHIGRKHRDA